MMKIIKKTLINNRKKKKRIFILLIKFIKTYKKRRLILKINYNPYNKIMIKINV